MKTSLETKNVLKALAALKEEMGNVTKSSENPFFKSSYADLNAHLEVVEPLARKHGLVVTQGVNTYNAETGPFSTVETRLSHTESGEFVYSELLLVMPKQDMQNMGSAVTYARRYTLGALLGMKAVDDDGQLATHGNNTTKTALATTTNAPAASKGSFRRNKKASNGAAVTTPPVTTTQVGNSEGGWD